jgi:hypothetical protein
MKRWKGTLVVSYTQEVEVEANTQDEAEMKMYESFDPSKVTYSSECQAYDVEEITGEETC